MRRALQAADKIAATMQNNTMHVDPTVQRILSRVPCSETRADLRNVDGTRAELKTHLFWPRGKTLILVRLVPGTSSGANRLGSRAAKPNLIREFIA